MSLYACALLTRTYLTGFTSSAGPAGLTGIAQRLYSEAVIACDHSLFAASSPIFSPTMLFPRACCCEGIN